MATKKIPDVAKVYCKNCGFAYNVNMTAKQLTSWNYGHDWNGADEAYRKLDKQDQELIDFGLCESCKLDNEAEVQYNIRKRRYHYR